MKPMVLLDIIYLELNNGTVGEKYSNNRFVVWVFVFGVLNKRRGSNFGKCGI